MKKTLLLLTAILLAGCSPMAASSQVTSDTQKPTDNSRISVEYTSDTYSNPLTVISGGGTTYNSDIADPSIVRDPDSGKFYIFATNMIVLSSTDACNWTKENYNALTSYPSWGKEIYPDTKLDIWAPDVIRIGNQWIYYYSLSAWGKCAGIGYATSNTLAGPYTDQGKLFSVDDIGIENCIDPQVFIDDDGTIYMTVGSFQGNYLVKLTEDGMGLEDGVSYQNKHKILIAGKASRWDGSQYEGGYIIKHDGDYYYFASSGTCNEGFDSTYKVMVGRSNTIDGVYRGADGMPMKMSANGTTYGNLVLWAGTNQDRNTAGPGHNSILRDDAGDYWIYYHSYCRYDSFSTKHLMMDKLLWDKDGFPYIENHKPSYQEDLDGPKLI